MKDVGTCDKSKGAGNRAMILESPNGETQSVLQITHTRMHTVWGRTQRTETSQ